ncbi:MAG TPA: helicase-exonuclease AddAB subunit AddA [Tepidisphaeraceae bacterium]|nr:helicase-exonuclease AddAB subunit AddA [Tepidisphaeraceae bacterium]
MASPTPSWTPDQLRGIRTTGRSLLVSAAAGSGKTAVLAARCAHLVCDADPACDVNELLVVTFTEAAAAEMKARIERALRARLAHVKDENSRLERQLAMVERAQVSTLHGFCSKLIRQNFHLLGLDPTFQMLDGDEQQLLRAEVARDVFAHRYETDDGGAFAALVDAYAGGDDERLIPHVLRTYEMLCSLVDPKAWGDRALARLTEAADPLNTFESTELGNELAGLIRARLDTLCRRCDDAARVIGGYEGLGKFGDYVRQLGLIANDWKDLLGARGLDGLAAVVLGFKLEFRKPTIKGDVPGKDLASALIKSIQDALKGGEIHALASFSVAEWRAGLRSVLPSAAELLALVTEFGDRYRAAKDRARRLDFNDLERYALRILRDASCTGAELRPSAVARAAHKQFSHVLVDEYQDINEVQDAILHLVSRECLAVGWAPPTIRADDVPDAQSAIPTLNLFTVGDVKQSIYRFRLAEPTRFLNRDQRFRAPDRGLVTSVAERPPQDIAPGEVIDLQQNFRSRGPLLECVNHVFRRLMTRAAAEIEYDGSHELRPGAGYPQDLPDTFPGAPIELHLLPDDLSADDDHAGESDPASTDEDELGRAEREAAFVAVRIRELLGIDAVGNQVGPRMQVMEKGPDGAFVPRPMRFGDVVVLLRSMRVKSDQYASILRSAGIPAYRDGGAGYFDSMEVRDVRSLLTLLDNQHQDIPFAAVLRSPLAGLPDPEDCLARIRLAYPARGSQRAARDSEPVPFHIAVTRYALEKDDELAARLRDFLDQLARWRQVARHRPLAELIWEIYDQTGYLALVEGLAAGQQRVANLLELHRRAAQFGSFARQGLYRFLRFLDQLESETDAGQPSVLSEAADVVRIMSVHHSKGLEFPVVFLPEMGKRFNLQDARGPILLDRNAGLALSAVDHAKRIRYPSLATVLVRESIRRQSLAEELRILYVAMTRAKEHLILSGTCATSKLEAWQTAWTGHPGPMPAADVQAAGTTLDWLGPVAAMTAADNALAVTPHTADEVARWTGPELRRPTLTAEQEHLARLEPLSPAPPMTAEADAIVHRLTARYAHAELTKIEAARGVTAWLKQGRDLPAGYDARTIPTTPHAEPDGDAPDASPPPSGATATRPTAFEADDAPSRGRAAAAPNALLPLATPRCRAESSVTSAADIGTATHLALQYLDLARGSHELDLQLIDFANRRLLTPAQVAAVDRAAIEWFFDTPLGRRLAKHAADVRRELSFTFAVDPSEVGATAAATTSPDDRVMIRGRVDALLPTAAGLTVIDYKTDRLTAGTLAARVDFYRPQVDLYRRALAHITKRPVTEVALVFLNARAIEYV